MTWKGNSLVAGLFKCNPSNICAAFYQIQLTACLRGPLATTGLLVSSHLRNNFSFTLFLFLAIRTRSVLPWYYSYSLVSVTFCYSVILQTLYCLQCLPCWLSTQEEHLACKNWAMSCWHSYLFGTRCRWFAYSPADATALPSFIFCFITIHSTFLMQAYWDCPAKAAFKHTGDVILYCICILHLSRVW